MFKKLKEDYNNYDGPKYKYVFGLVKGCLIEFIICTLVLYSPA